MNQAAELQKLNEQLTSDTLNGAELDSVYHAQYLQQLENVASLQINLDSVKDELESE
jgi:hypothetical protein